MCIRDSYRLHRHGPNARENHWASRHAQRMHRDHRGGMDRVLAHVREHGAVKSSDFERPRRGGAGWWGWKDEKRWLEALFAPVSYTHLRAHETPEHLVCRL